MTFTSLTQTWNRRETNFRSHKMVIYRRKRMIDLSSCGKWKYPRTNHCDKEKKKVQKEKQASCKYLWFKNLSFFFFLFVPRKSKTLPLSQSNIMNIDSWRGWSLNLGWNVSSHWKCSVSDPPSTAHFKFNYFLYKLKKLCFSSTVQKCWADAGSWHGGNILLKISPVHLGSFFLWKRCQFFPH